MKKAFIKTLSELAEQDERIVLLTGDLGFMALEQFSERFKDRFFNVGVAENNMVGIATGLAEAGFLPFVYSIAPFATLRPYEFIRNGPVLHGFPVRIIGVGGGFEYGFNGATHYGLEDIGIMRIQPGMTIIAPADYMQVRAALLSTWDLPGPVYYRIGKDDETLINGLGGKFRLGGAQFIGQGRDLLFITSGSITREVALAVKSLDSQGISCTMMIIASISPVPTDDLVNALRNFRIALSVEDHYVTGGIGSMVSEVIAENQLACQLIRCGMRLVPDGITGSKSFLYHKYGLSADNLVKTALQAIGKKS